MVQVAAPADTVLVQIVPLTESPKITLPVGEATPLPAEPVTVAVKVRVAP